MTLTHDRSDRRGHRRSSSPGCELAHPVLNGSGTFDAIAALRTFGDALRERLPVLGLRLEDDHPRASRRQPAARLWEAPAGLINSIGLPNKGLEGFLARDLPELATLPVPLIVSVAGFSHERVRALVEGVGDRDEVAALELNVSCPNVKSGCVIGSRAGRDGRSDGAACARSRAKPLIVKLTPNVSDVVPVAKAAEAGGR